METTDIIILVATIIYYISIGFLSLLSFFSVYILIRYGRSPLVSLLVSILYTIFFLIILGNSYRILQTF